MMVERPASEPRPLSEDELRELFAEIPPHYPTLRPFDAVNSFLLLTQRGIGEIEAMLARQADRKPPE